MLDLPAGMPMPSRSSRIDAGQIEVRTASPLSETDPNLDPSGDRLLYLVLQRCGRAAIFLPDLIEKAVADGFLDVDVVEQALLAIRSRQPVGFVEHSLRRLEGVI